MDTRRIRIFNIVAEELHFSRAAERLNLSQPAVSLQIQALEQELGVALFERKRSRVALTPAGKALLIESEALVARLDRIVETLGGIARGEIGILKIAFNELAGQQALLGVAIRDFRARNPHVQIDMTQLTSSVQIEALLTGTIDAGFLYTLSGSPEELKSLPLQRDTFVVATLSSDPLAARNELIQPDLAGRTLILPSQRVFPQMHRRLMQYLASEDIHPASVIEVASDLAAINLVSTGTGIAIVPSTRRWGGTNDITFRPLPGRMVEIRLELCWRDKSPLIERFVEVVKKAW